MAATTVIENPFRVGLRRRAKPEPSVLVFFGGSGDLMRRKLMPSLYELETRELLPGGTAIVGLARTQRERDTYQEHMREALTEFLPGPIDDNVWKRLADRLYYISATFDDNNAYSELGQMLNQLSSERHTNGNTIFYLASSPSFFTTIIEHIDKSGLAHSGPGWKRIVVEKPFGRDLQSARELNDLVAKVFTESDVYRIDHYLGKETVQNILVFRFANAIFEPVWNRRYIDHVQITAAESIGIEGRGDYYEEAGALRDMVQNHCLELLSLVAMEPPWAFEADAVRDEKVKVLRSVRHILPTEVDSFVVRGQYGPGIVDGQPAPGYRQEEEVSPTSSVETYVAAKFYVDNWRWQGVPFYARTGKRLVKKKTEVSIQFKPVPHVLFGSTPAASPPPNELVMRIQPDEGISLKIETKAPGPVTIPRSVDLDFRYVSSFGIVPPEDYQVLLLDCMLGDQTLFARRDTVEIQWSVVTPILQGWEASTPPNFPNYKAGTWGPPEADQMMERDGRKWRRL